MPPGTFILQVFVPVDEIVHSLARPFCDQRSCPCHEDHDLWNELCFLPVQEGLLTPEEAERIYYGAQIGEAQA